MLYKLCTFNKVNDMENNLMFVGIICQYCVRFSF